MWAVKIDRSDPTLLHDCSSDSGAQGDHDGVAQLLSCALPDLANESAAGVVINGHQVLAVLVDEVGELQVAELWQVGTYQYVFMIGGDSAGDADANGSQRLLLVGNFFQGLEERIRVFGGGELAGGYLGAIFKKDAPGCFCTATIKTEKTEWIHK